MLDPRVMLRSLRHHRLLRTTPRTRIGDAPRAATVKLVGAVGSRGQPVHTPVSDTPCAYWELVIDEWGDGVASTVVHRTSSAPLSIDDGTGVGLVDLASAAVHLSAEHREIFGLVREAPYVIARLMAEEGRSAVDECGLLKGITYRERILLDGDTVAVWGRAEWDVAVDKGSLAGAGYRELPELLLVRSPRSGPTLISDDRKAIAT